MQYTNNIIYILFLTISRKILHCTPGSFTIIILLRIIYNDMYELYGNSQKLLEKNQVCVLLFLKLQLRKIFYILIVGAVMNEKPWTDKEIIVTQVILNIKKMPPSWKMCTKKQVSIKLFSSRKIFLYNLQYLQLFFETKPC